MYGDWVEVINPNEVSRITHLVLADSDEDSLKEYLMNMFHKVLQNRAVTMYSFDTEATKLLIQLIRSKYSEQGLIYMVLKTYVYHTYMVSYHKMNSDEFRLLRYKLRKVTDENASF